MRAPPFNFEGFYFCRLICVPKIRSHAIVWCKRTETVATQPLAEYTLEERLADLSGRNFVKLKQDKSN